MGCKCSLVQIAIRGYSRAWCRSFLFRIEKQCKHWDPLKPSNPLFGKVLNTESSSSHRIHRLQANKSNSQRHWAKLPGDGTTTWQDAELTPAGEQQAQAIAAFWKTDDIPTPGHIYSSPLRRCLRTTMLAFAPFLDSQATPPPPSIPLTIKEKLRERLGVHTCDRRSSKTWIAAAYPAFEIESGFAEEDELWVPDRRETIEEHAVRSRELLGEIFSGDASDVVALTAHSGAIMALFVATGWKQIPVAAGAVYPLLVCATRS